MKILEWDEELATIAQRHADQCVFAHDCSDCRKVNRFGVGQNLYISKQSLRLPDNNWKQGITNWYDEVSLFSRTKVEPFQFAASYGHYSQLVWADTHKIGCGLSSYREGKWFASLYTCNYGPNGNFIKGQMYKQGSGCSECSGNETCSIDFPGLCEPRSSAFTPPRPTFVPTPKPSVQTEKPFIITNPEPTPKPTPRPTPPPTPRPTPKPFQTPRFIPTSSPVLNPVFTPKFAPVPNTGLKNFAPTSNRFIPQSVRTTEQPSFKPAARNPNSSSTNSTLFYCGFETEESSCKVRSGGSKWVRSENFFSGIQNHYFGAELNPGDQTEFFFESLIAPPPGGIACLDFRYKKYSTADSVPLTVMAWPFKGKPGKINIIRDSPDPGTWIRAQVTYRNIDNYFLVMLRGKGPAQTRGKLYLAVDDLTVREGQCDD
ncbi:peptidase inhibitor 16 [Eurytemora carolleeae]|uniref:peptidase inhibitor 16 n=1 Tax=Eurytemora carolleeae TaxID=1294199 RepID=UPI000C76AA6A|nr:peptidase inhibitor 16 [Eurytemora carolleeae]|eukprot:XP_023342239.1 peptidase inhibitor 16-like [Eurytemora affinis]